MLFLKRSAAMARAAEEQALSGWNSSWTAGDKDETTEQEQYDKADKTDETRQSAEGGGIPHVFHRIWIQGSSEIPAAYEENWRSCQVHHPSWTFVTWSAVDGASDIEGRASRLIDTPQSGVESGGENEGGSGGGNGGHVSAERTCEGDGSGSGSGSGTESGGGNKRFTLQLQNRQLFDATDDLRAKSDILRYEVLYRFGGVYVDSDLRCRKSLAPLLQLQPQHQRSKGGKGGGHAESDKSPVPVPVPVPVTAFAAYETPELLNIAILGSVRGHPLYTRLVHMLPRWIERMDRLHRFEIYQRTGPAFFTHVWHSLPESKRLEHPLSPPNASPHSPSAHVSPGSLPRPPLGVTIFPTAWFYPFHFLHMHGLDEAELRPLMPSFLNAISSAYTTQHETRGRGQGWSPGPKGSWRICITHGPIERPQQWCGCRSLAQLGVDLDPTAPEAESRFKSASSSSSDSTGSDPSVVSVAANEEKDPNVVQCLRGKAGSLTPGPATDLSAEDFSKSSLPGAAGVSPKKQTSSTNLKSSGNDAMDLLNAISDTDRDESVKKDSYAGGDKKVMKQKMKFKDQDYADMSCAVDSCTVCPFAKKACCNNFIHVSGQCEDCVMKIGCAGSFAHQLYELSDCGCDVCLQPKADDNRN
eukprot:g620.t1